MAYALIWQDIPHASAATLYMKVLPVRHTKNYPGSTKFTEII